MTRYRSIHCLIWNDDKFPFATDQCQLVFFHILTTPMSTPFGLYKASVEALAAEKRWDVKAYRKAFEEAFRAGFVKYDERAQVILIPNFLKYNPPNNPNVLKAWANIYEEIPKSPLKDEFFQSLKAFLEDLGEGFDKAFAKAWRKPMPIQEQDQDQDQEQNKDKDQEQKTTAKVVKIGVTAISEHGNYDWPTPEAFVALYNTNTPADHPKVTLLTPERRKRILLYLDLFPDKPFWEQVYVELSLSPFLRGQKASKDRRPVKRGFDWLLSKGEDHLENCVKTFEGKYRETKIDLVRARTTNTEYRSLQAGQRFVERHSGDQGQHPVPSSDATIVDCTEYRIN